MRPHETSENRESRTLSEPPPVDGSLSKSALIMTRIGWLEVLIVVVVAA
jgi:hypothetical protein